MKVRKLFKYLCPTCLRPAYFTPTIVTESLLENCVHCGIELDGVKREYFILLEKEELEVLSL